MRSGIILIISVFLWYQTSESKIIESNFYREEPCAAKNGFCVLRNECPGEIGEEFEQLCANQKSAGAVCCPHIKAEDTNCYQLHNQCTTKCPEALTLGRKGCLDNSVCCVLV